MPPPSKTAIPAPARARRVRMLAHPKSKGMTSARTCHAPERRPIQVERLGFNGPLRSVIQPVGGPRVENCSWHRRAPTRSCPCGRTCSLRTRYCARPPHTLRGGTPPGRSTHRSLPPPNGRCDPPALPSRLHFTARAEPGPNLSIPAAGGGGRLLDRFLAQTMSVIETLEQGSRMTCSAVRKSRADRSVRCARP